MPPYEISTTTPCVALYADDDGPNDQSFIP